MSGQVVFILCACVSVTLAQHQLPNYFQGSFDIPNAPIPAPGPAAVARPLQTGAYQPSPQAYAQYATARSPSNTGAYAAPPPAVAYAGSPVSPGVPSSYGWQVQHSSPAPQPQPQVAAQPALIPAHAAAGGQISRSATLQQYAAQPQAVARQQWQSPAPAAPAPTPVAHQQWQSPAPASPSPVAYQAPQAQPTATPISAALHRPASVHYASVGENLNGDYKFGYRTGNGDSFREETRAPDGTVQGQYGFVDADGKQRVVKYTAGVGGFQVLSDGAATTPVAAAPAAASWPRQQHASAQAQPNWG